MFFCRKYMVLLDKWVGVFWKWFMVLNSVYLKALWNSESCFPKTKESIKKLENFNRNKDKSAEHLCYLNPPIWQGMLDNFLADEVDTWGKRDTVLQKDMENTVKKCIGWPKVANYWPGLWWHELNGGHLKPMGMKLWQWWIIFR